MDKCADCSGIVAEIKNLQKEEQEQWAVIEKQSERINGIVGRINIVLGGIVVSVVLLVINLVVAFAGGKP